MDKPAPESDSEAHLLARSLELARLGTYLWDPETNRLDYSEQAAKLYGARRQDLTFEFVSKLILPEDVPALSAANQATLKGGPPFTHDYRIQLGDGKVRWLQARGALEVRGDKRFMVGTLQDVTDRKELEKARDEATAQAAEAQHLRELNEFKSRFINIAAHELKTPLTPMRIQLALLRVVHGAKLDEGQRKSLDILHRNLERLAHLVEDVLQAARIQASSLKLEVKPIDVSTLVRYLVESFEDGAKQVGVQLEAHIAPELRAEADGVRIEQVLSNLLTNALKFTPEGGRIEVKASVEGPSVVLKVTDTGLGMTSEQLGRLFLPFSQVHGDASQRLQGTGLGLFICKGIVEEHGGTIGAESDGPGRGSRFTVRLPSTTKAVPSSSPVAKPTVAKRFRELI